MDNAPIHTHINLSNELHEIKFLPRYSPFLNPIEESFSCWKYKLKEYLADPYNVSRVGDNSAAAAAEVSLHQWRTTILIELATTALTEITSEKVQGCVRHSLSFFPKINKLEDL